MLCSQQQPPEKTTHQGVGMVTQPENYDFISGCFWIQIASKASSRGSLSLPPMAFATLLSFMFSTTIIKWPVSVSIHAQWRLVLSLLS